MPFNASGPRQSAQAISADQRIWAIAGPAILSNITVASIGLVDSWAVGQVPGAAELAGLALGAYGLSSFGWALSFLRMGTTGLVAQARGARRTRQIMRILLRSAILAGLFGIFLWVIKSPASEAMLWALGAQGAERDIAAAYITIRLWAAPFILLKMAVIGLLIGLQRTDVALGLEVSVNAVNLALTTWFVLGLNMGAVGAAIASLIAESLAGIAALMLATKALRLQLLRKMLMSAALWHIGAFTDILKVNGYLFARTLILILGFGLFLANAQKMGTATLAACHILLNFYVLQALTLDGIAYAAEALVGEAIGAGSRQQMRFWVVRSSLWAFGFGLLYLLGFSLAGEWLFHIFTSDAQVRAAAQPLYLWIALTPPVAVACYQLDGVFIGAAQARPMFTTMLVSLAGMQALIWSFMPAYGVSGLCAAFLGFFAMRGLGLIAAYPAMERRVV
ncbi:MAG: MATE family efflux transporter [Pseudomonadota bacterium]